MVIFKFNSISFNNFSIDNLQLFTYKAFEIHTKDSIFSNKFSLSTTKDVYKLNFCDNLCNSAKTLKSDQSLFDKINFVDDVFLSKYGINISPVLLFEAYFLPSTHRFLCNKIL